MNITQHDKDQFLETLKERIQARKDPRILVREMLEYGGFDYERTWSIIKELREEQRIRCGGDDRSPWVALVVSDVHEQMTFWARFSGKYEQLTLKDVQEITGLEPADAMQLCADLVKRGIVSVEELLISCGPNGRD